MGEAKRKAGMQQQLTERAPPGTIGEYHAVFSREREDRTALEDRSKRIFNVTYHFARRPDFVSEGTINISPDVDAGRSFLRPIKPNSIPPHANTFLQAPNGSRAEIHLNALGEMAAISTNIEATRHSEAFSVAAELIEPWIDNLAFVSNTPIFVSQVCYFDAKHSMTGTTYTSPYVDLNLHGGGAAFPIELRPIFSIYREGLCSTSRYYRFLCFYKILEGIKKRRDGSLYRKAKEAKIEIAHPREVLPPDAELQRMQPGLVGKPIWELFNGTWTGDFRQNIAHFEQEGIDVFLSYEGAARVANSLLPIQLATRVVVENYRTQIETLKAAGVTP